ncbi:MAG: PKD domain-containing protein [Microthrixaceae bacterium]
MKKFQRRAAVLAVASAVMILSACFPQPEPPTNLSPLAAATATPDTGEAPLEVSFDASDSSDPDGTIVSYAWDFGDGASGSGVITTHEYADAGDYTVTLTVTDDAGATATTTLEVSVLTAPDDPNGRYVAVGGADAGDCSTSAAPCATITYAVGQAVAGNTIYVGAGEYPEIVAPTKALTFKGANAGIAVGVEAGVRGPESTVRAFRNAANPASANSLTIDGFEIDPTSDPALLTNATAMVNVFGGPTVSIVNNVFTGAAAFVPTCGFTCTDMADSAIQVRGGVIDISDNAFVNWRRPVNLTQSDASLPITGSRIKDNVFTGITSRAISVGQNTGQNTMQGVLIDGNEIDATGRDLVASTPAGIVITNDSNLVIDNTFTGLSTGVFVNICKKFNTDGNTITSNTFAGNNGGVNLTTILDTSQCNSSATEGTGGWVVGGGRANDTLINDNSFVGQLNYAIRFNPNFGAYTVPVTADPIDATCNWFGSATGPTDPGVAGERILQGPIENAQIVATPWLTAQGGACDGGL